MTQGEYVFMENSSFWLKLAFLGEGGGREAAWGVGNVRKGARQRVGGEIG